jgi:hypothetical protein
MKVIFVVLGIVVCIGLHGEEGKSLMSGPTVGMPLTPVMAYDGLGEFKGQEIDVAKEIGLNPGALLFVHSMTRNTYHVIRAVDQQAGRNALLGFKAFTLFLSGDRTAAESQVVRRSGLATGGHRFSVAGKFGALKLERPILLSLDGVDGPGDYGLNRRAVLTLVIVNDGKVHRSVVFTDTGEHDVAAVEELVREVTQYDDTDLGSMRLIRDQRLPDDVVKLRSVATQFQAFWGREFRRGHPMLAIVEEKVGALPDPSTALDQVIEWNLPSDPVALKSMALRQAEELFRAQAQLAAANEGKGRYSMMRSADARNGMKTKPDAISRSVRGQGRSLGRGQTASIGAKPKDPELGNLLRALLPKTNSTDANDEIFADLKLRSVQSKNLREETLSMVRFFLGSENQYGSVYARRLAKEFLNADTSGKN